MRRLERHQPGSIVSGLYEELNERLSSSGPVTVGIAGFGHMGSTLFAQLNAMPGLRVAAVSTSRPDHLYQLLSEHPPYRELRAVRTESQTAASEAIADGSLVVTADASAMAQIENLDVVVDATGSPELGARLGWMALESGKHLTTFNIEADAVFGSILRAKAESVGVVYTGLSGDEPGALMELFNFARFLEFDVLALGKGKNNPLNRAFVPSMVPDREVGAFPSARSMCSFIDGTNTMVEMAAVANATGFAPDIRGMHGPSCAPSDLADTFSPISEGGILENGRVVDYATGSVAPGVFVIVRASDSIVDGVFDYVGIDKGPYRALFRPFHLISLEAPFSIAEAALRGQTTISSLSTSRTAEVIAIAKQDLEPGHQLDGIGGFSVRGEIERYDSSVAADLLPMGLVEGATVRTSIPKDQPITASDVDLCQESAALELWTRQKLWLEAPDHHDENVSQLLGEPLPSYASTCLDNQGKNDQ